MPIIVLQCRNQHIVISVTGDRTLINVGDNSRIASNAVVLREVPENATAVGIPAQIVRIAGKATHYADEVDQINVKDPVLERLAAVSSRLELLEKMLDEQYLKENQQEKQPAESEK